MGGECGGVGGGGGEFAEGGFGADEEEFCFVAVEFEFFCIQILSGRTYNVHACVSWELLHWGLKFEVYLFHKGTKYIDEHKYTGL